ncbi:hypothetical protein ABZ865_21325 [Streptomyces sp. NPDC047085]|uniref:hypothetical protein n=1 Tax=Streptomyces sp. NPDC047085 TaxID=3155140 RepID=UPI0033CA8031
MRDPNDDRAMDVVVLGEGGHRLRDGRDVLRADLCVRRTVDDLDRDAAFDVALFRALDIARPDPGVRESDLRRVLVRPAEEMVRVVGRRDGARELRGSDLAGDLGEFEVPLPLLLLQAARLARRRAAAAVLRVLFTGRSCSLCVWRGSKVMEL